MSIPTPASRPRHIFVVLWFLRLFRDYSKGLILAIIVFTLVGVSGEEFIVNGIKNFGVERPNETLRSKAKASARSLAWRSADSAEYSWLFEVFGAQFSRSKDKTHYGNQPFRVTYITADKSDYYIVFWPRICDSQGCRHDIIKYADHSTLGTTYSDNLRETSVVLNGYPVLSDVNGKLVYWDGKKYVSN